MTLYDLLNVMGNFNKYIQISYKGKNSGIMKVGNVTYRQLDHYCYKKHILSISPCIQGDKKYIFVQLVDD